LDDNEAREHDIEEVVQNDVGNLEQQDTEQPAKLLSAGNAGNNTIDLLSSDNTTQGMVRRNMRKPVWMADYERGNDLSDNEDNAMIVTDNDPVTDEEAVKSMTRRDVMRKEMEAIKKNKTWELTDFPTGMKHIGVKWIYKTRLKENEEIDKFKARLVVKGYAQKYGVDYTKVFAPVAKMNTIRNLLSMVGVSINLM